MGWDWYNVLLLDRLLLLAERISIAPPLSLLGSTLRIRSRLACSLVQVLYTFPPFGKCSVDYRLPVLDSEA